MTVKYKVIVKPKSRPPIGTFKFEEQYHLFNYTLIEEYEDIPEYFILYAYLYQTDIIVNNGDPTSIIYQRLGNLPASEDFRANIEGTLVMTELSRWQKRYKARTKMPITANYTFVHPDILYSNELSIYEKADYIKAVKNLSLRRRLEDKKLIVPASYVELPVELIPGITQSPDKTKIRFNLEEQVKIIKEKG